MNRDGFVMPLALVVLVAISLLAVTALQLAVTDFRANRGTRVAHRALFAAEAGAHSILARWSSGPYASMSPGDSAATAWEELPDGSVYRGVVLRVDDGVDDDVGPLFRVTAEGRPSRRESAARTVTLMVRGTGTPDLCCDAAIQIDGRVRLNGPVSSPGGGRGRGRGGGGGGGSAPDSVTMADGRDHVPMSWAAYCPTPGAAVSGVTLPDLTRLELLGDVDLEGTPESEEDPSIGPDLVTTLGSWTYDYLAAQATLSISGNNVRYTQPVTPSASGGECTVTDSLNWGAPASPGSACWDYLPLIHADGTLRVEDGGSGQGLLLVDGDLYLSEDFHFYGLIVVKGRTVLENEAKITGGLIGANRGISGLRTELNDSSSVQYSSCAVARATAGLAGIERLPGRSWFEVS